MMMNLHQTLTQTQTQTADDDEQDDRAIELAPGHKARHWIISCQNVLSTRLDTGGAQLFAGHSKAFTHTLVPIHLLFASL